MGDRYWFPPADCLEDVLDGLVDVIRRELLNAGEMNVDADVADAIDKEVQWLNHVEGTIDRLDREALSMVARRELFEGLNSRASELPSSKGIHALNSFIMALLNDQVMALCRVWDRDESSFSISVLVGELDRKGFLKEVLQRRFESFRRLWVHGKLDVSGLSADEGRAKLCEEIHRTHDDILAGFEWTINNTHSLKQTAMQIQDSDSLVHTREHRNSNIAHGAEMSRVGKKRESKDLEVRGPFLEELMDLTVQTLGITSDLVMMLDDRATSYDDWTQVCFDRTEDLIIGVFPLLADVPRSGGGEKD